VDSFIYCYSCSSAVACRRKSRLHDYSIPSSRSKRSLMSRYDAKFNLRTECFRSSRRVSDFPPRNFGDASRPDVRDILLFTEWNSPELLDIRRHAGDCPGRILIGKIFLSFEETSQVPLTSLIVS